MYYIQILYLLLLAVDAKPSSLPPCLDQESSSVSIGSNLLRLWYDSVIAIAVRCTYSEVSACITV